MANCIQKMSSSVYTCLKSYISYRQQFSSSKMQSIDRKKKFLNY